MEIEMTNCSPTLEREPEPCVFSIEDPDPHCILCGQQCSHGMMCWHPGPIIRASGWFETREAYGLDADVWRDVKLLYRGDWLFPDMLIMVTGYEPISDTTHRYSFHGQKHVGVDKVEKEMA